MDGELETKREFTNEYFGNLESLRGIAAIVVAFVHIAWVFPLYHAPFVRNGYLMVDFFFVLSGFVIYHSYRNYFEGARSLKSFMWLRFWRLYPLHFFFLVTFLGIEGLEWLREWWIQDVGDAGAFQAQNNLSSFITNVFLVHSLGFHDRLTYNAPSWSISTEFYAYLLFGVLMCLFSSPMARRIAAIVTMATGFCVLFYVGKRHIDVTVDYGFFRCVAGFFAGVLTYDVYRYVRDKRDWNLHSDLIGIIQAAALVAVAVFLGIKSKGYSDFAIIPFVSIIVLLTALVPNSPSGKVLALRPLRWAGKVSYSIYMIHPAVFWMFYQTLKFVFKAQPGVDSRFNPDLLYPSTTLGTVFFVIALASVFILSELTYRWIENPFRVWSKKRLLSN